MSLFVVVVWGCGTENKTLTFPSSVCDFCDTGILTHLILEIIKGVYAIRINQAGRLATDKIEGICAVCESYFS